MNHKFTKIIPGRLTLLYTVCLAILFFSPMPVVKAEGVAKLLASAVDMGGEKDRKAAVALHLEENPGLWGMRLKVTFDASVLTLMSVDSGGLFGKDDVFLPENKNNNGQMIFLVTANQPKDVSANGTLATLQFDVVKGSSAGNSPVTVEVIEAVNFAGTRFQVTTTGISVATPTLQKKSTDSAEIKEGSSTQNTADADEAFKTPEDAQPPRKETDGAAVNAPEKSKKRFFVWIAFCTIALAGMTGGVYWYVVRRGRIIS